MDRIEKIGSSVIQHGKENDRIYLMKLHPDDKSMVTERLLALAGQNNYGKIFCKVPSWAESHFLNAGFIIEVKIPEFYQDGSDMLFVSFFCNPDRGILDKEEKTLIQKSLKLADQKAERQSAFKIDQKFHIRKLINENLDALKNLYEATFDSYPFPIDNVLYLKSTMAEYVDYYGIYDQERLIAAASAEKDKAEGMAEMTDFATDKDYRAQGLAAVLLHFMEKQMKQSGIRNLYTIARAISPGINICFAKNGYTFAGTLIHNTQISGSIESMNIWYKKLSA